MKKVVCSFFVAAMTWGFSVSAEAANIVLLPLVNNLAYNGVAVNQIYYDRAIEALKNQAAYEILDGSKVEASIAKHTKEAALPDELALKAIAQETGADLVFAMEVQELSSKVNRLSNTGNLLVKVRGTAASYDKETDKYIAHRVNAQSSQPEAFNARYKLKEQAFANAVTREINRILKIKKIKLEKPRISRF